SHTIADNGKTISGAFVITVNGSGLRVQSGSVSYDLDGDILIKAENCATTHLLQINKGYKYAGDLRVINKNGTLKLINHVDMETYVMGVLPYEMSNGWPLEALKAQAVAARSYAYYVMYSRNRDTVEQDLVNTTASQVYYGYNAAQTNCIRAVTETKNTILKTAAGANVYACFSASNGGYTEYAKSSGAAASNFDYLPYKQDPYDLAYTLASDLYSGKTVIPKALAAASLRDSTAQPYKMLRENLSAAGVDVSGIAADAVVRSLVLTNPRYTGPDRAFLGAQIVIGLPQIGETPARDITLNLAPYVPAGSSAKYPFLNGVLGLGTKYSMLCLRDDGASWLIASVRYGHASGLSQVGAYQMSSQGKSYSDILAFYYNVGSATKLVVMPWTVDTGGSASGSPASGTVNAAAGLNVRSGAGVSYSILGALSKGKAVQITGQTGDWYHIDYNGKAGYVNKAYVTLAAGAQIPGTPATPAAPSVPSAPAEPSEPAAPQTQTGTVNTPGTTLNVRGGPGTTYAILGSLKHGAAVTVAGETGNWYQISYNGKTAYVSKSYVKIGTAVQTKTGTVNTAAGLNVRGGPGTNYKILTVLKNGTKVTITGQSGSWYKISYSGSEGYVSAAYIK
ncbi:MAG: SH3 domain-containing protein, partial [Clostridiales Family XIII bacterium]|nr:SH3 domain-containing protein [Clostridiales Family XIII bacterium]